MRATIAVLMILAATSAAAQTSPWDRNQMYVGYYICTTQAMTRMERDEKADSWIPKIVDEKKTYNIDVVPGTYETQEYEAKASQYLIRSWNKGEKTNACLMHGVETVHAPDTVAIEKSGKVECSMFDAGNAYHTWMFDLKNGRYVRTSNSGIFKMWGEFVSPPEMEIGICKKQ